MSHSPDTGPTTAHDHALVVRSSIARSFGLAVSVVVSFVMMPIVVKALGDRWYGMWSLAATVMGYYGFLDFGLSSAVQRYIARAVAERRDDQVESLVTTAMLVFLLAGAVALTISLMVGFSAPLFFSDPAEAATFRGLMCLMALSPFLEFPMMAFSGLFTAHLRYDIVVGVDTAKLLLRTAAILYLLSIGRLSVLTLAVITLAIDVPFVAIRVGLIRWVFGTVPVRVRGVRLKLLPELLSFGGKSLVVQLSELLRFELDSFVVATFVGLRAVTHYGIGSQLVIYVRRLVSMTVNVLVPLYARLHALDDWQSMRSLFYFSIKISTTICVVLGSTILLFGKPFIGLWMGAAYTDAYTIVLILGVSSLIQVSVQPAVNLLFATAKHGPYATMCIVEGILNLVLSVGLASSLGMYGVALGTAMPMIVASVWLVGFTTRQLDGSWRRYVASAGRVLVIGAFASALFAPILHRWPPRSYLALLVGAGVCGAIQTGLVLVFGFSRTERHVLVAAVRAAVFGARRGADDRSDAGRS